MRSFFAATALASLVLAAPSSTSCKANKLGTGPIPSPDTPAAFLAYTAFGGNATAATTPSGFTQTFVNLTAANNAQGYLGYMTLTSYDTQACATRCSKTGGCNSFNIYYERDPVVNPGAGNSSCANPKSTTTIKCSFWGGVVNTTNAVNAGQWQNKFRVVIAGSNGYVNSTMLQLAAPSCTPFQSFVLRSAVTNRWLQLVYAWGGAFTAPFSSDAQVLYFDADCSLVTGTGHVDILGAAAFIAPPISSKVDSAVVQWGFDDAIAAVNGVKLQCAQNPTADGNLLQCGYGGTSYLNIGSNWTLGNAGHEQDSYFVFYEPPPER